MSTTPRPPPVLRVAHLTTVDLSLRFLLWPQLLAVVDNGGEAYGISSPGPWVEELTEAGIEHIALQSSTRGVSLLADVRAALEFWRELRRTPLTVLHTHNPKPGIYGRILGRLAGVPVVVNTLHGFYATETDPLPKRAIVYGLEALAARFSDAELHQNVEDLELAKRLHIVRPSRARLLGNGIDLTRFDPSSVDRGARRRIREELGAGDDDVVVGTVGRLVAEKGFPELFEAAEELGRGFVLAVIGPVDPDKPDALPAAMIERAEAAGVRFLGMRKDMEDLYSGMDIFVLPSHREGFPRAAMEAAAMGLPVVATDIRGCRQVVKHGVNGLLVPVRDHERLRDALRLLGGDPERRLAMSAASRSIALEEFDERRVVRIVMETYRDLLEAKGISHLFPAAMVGNRGTVEMREAHAADAARLSDLHWGLVEEGFLPKVSRRFSRNLYRALLRWPGTCAIVAEDEGGPVGLVIAVSDVPGFWRRFVSSRWLTAGLTALPALVRRGTVEHGRRALRRGGGRDETAITLALAQRVHGQATAGRLLESLLARLDTGRSQRAVVASGDQLGVDVFVMAGFEESDPAVGDDSALVLTRRPD